MTNMEWQKLIYSWLTQVNSLGFMHSPMNISTFLSSFIEFKDLKNLASAYNTLGFIYYYFDDHENRLEVNLKSLEMSRSLGDEKAMFEVPQ